MAEKIYYSMGEVSEMLDVNPSLLRFWEKRFDIIAPSKNKKGNRLFSPADVRNLKTIYHLVKERGMTLAGAEKQLRARRSEIERDMEIAERLGAIRSLLLEVRNELGGGGTVVDNAVTEEAVEVAVAGSVEPAIEHEVKPEAGSVVGHAAEIPAAGLEVEPIVEPTVEPVVEPTDPIGHVAPVAEAKPEIKYIEQTLF